MTTPNRKIVEIEVWGSVNYIDTSYKNQSEIEKGLSELKIYFQKIDLIFSTYKYESEVSRFRRGEIKVEQSSEEFQEVYENCAKLKELTEGAFDPWALRAGFDPSGFVKGWACDYGAKILQNHGAESIQINGAGDLTLRGGYPTAEDPKAPWKIGIRDPEDAKSIVKVFEIFDGAIATSGSYERGGHIVDPFNGSVAIGALSATVYGPEGGVADALATALMVTGKDGAQIFNQEYFAEYGCWVIERHTREAWGYHGKASKIK